MPDSSTFEYFQPQLSVPTGRVTAIEIFSLDPVQEHEKCRHVDQGIVAAARALKTLADNGHRHLSVCVTVPWTWIEDARAVTLAMQVVSEAHVAPCNLIVQVSDETPLTHVPLAVRSMAKLSRHGVQVSVSNFGAAINSHYHLRYLPVTSIRVDASLMDARRGSARDAVILRSLIEMVREMNIRVTVDGINSQDDLAFAAEAQADIVQGNFIAPPTRLELLISWLNTTNRLTASRALNTRPRTA